jgi:predicted site-specific integrase-resolvase
LTGSAGLLSARQLGAQLGVAPATLTRWHRVGLIETAGHDHRGYPLFHAGQQRPTREQITGAGRPAAHRGQDLLTGGQLAARLGVARSTVYKWYRLGLIDAVTVDHRGRHLYRTDQDAPAPDQVTSARAIAAAART